MKVTKVETLPLSIPYAHDEVSSHIVRGGATNVVVKLTADNGLVGWGEAVGSPNAASVVDVIEAASDLVRGRDPWRSEDLWNDLFRNALWVSPDFSNPSWRCVKWS